jgi:predicted ATP-grasp superfamily ATP-dependent carboligase
MRKVLICGSSTRAVGESAAGAGYSVTTIDAFADRDQHPSVQALCAARDFGMPPTASAMARAARSVRRDATVYLSPFENHPRAVGTLAAEGVLLGNAPDTLRRVRDPFALADVLKSQGFAVPRSVEGASGARGARGAWIQKPFRSGGGNRICTWEGRPPPRGSYLQERLDGTPGSIVFVAGNGACVPIAFSRQLVGDVNFGGAAFRYCGSIVAPLGDRQFRDGAALFDAASAVARCVSSAFGLVGVNGIDFIARDRIVSPLEVNPRWCSSIEVAERAFGMTFFPLHVAACSGGMTPRFDCAAALERTHACGKAIVYARQAVSVGDTSRWLNDAAVRDVPRSGERFRAGQPICSVFANAASSEECYRLLVNRARRIYAELDRSRRSA